ncbi:MAG: GDSL-type esterase/lipase family protein [Spirochaetaceae bacterium]|nr:GDSL-type esterase/lipase family protein [Spirochaetaceae bacterium]
MFDNNRVSEQIQWVSYPLDKKEIFWYNETADSRQQTADSRQQTADSRQHYGLLITNLITLLLLVIIGIHYDIPRKLVIKISGNYHDFYTHYEMKNILFSIYEKGPYRIVMLGDSITEGVAWNELLGVMDIANRGIGGDTTEGILNRLSSIYELNPEICFLMAGINDIGKGIPVDIIIKNMEKIIMGLEHNGIKVIVQSTLFVSENAKNYDSINEKVGQVNKWLEKYCNDKNIIFLNINETLSINNYLNPEYTYDGVHLLGIGYDKWKELLLPIIK